LDQEENDVTDQRIPTAERQAIEWLLRVEALTDPAVQDLLVTAVADCSPFIQRVEFGIDRSNRAILVFLEIPSWVRRVFGTLVSSKVEEQVRALLPAFRVTVTFDHSDLARFVEQSS
jgi:hypothetical protein